MNSFNHYAYGAIGQFIYERIAGIKPLKAGYKEILIAPIPGGPLTTAQASYQCPYGEISSSWEIKNDVFKLNATVPPNATARIIIHADTNKELKLNRKLFAENPNVKILKKSDDAFELKVQPGTYVFESKLK